MIRERLWNTGGYCGILKDAVGYSEATVAGAIWNEKVIDDDSNDIGGIGKEKGFEIKTSKYD